jgi:CDP-6-deoxy-D-xylo-4-hexulose-3-dehydrase
MMRPTEVQAAFGLAQLTRLPSIIKKRADVFKRIRAFLARYEDRIILPETENGARTSWLAFPITFREDSGIDRNAFARFLEDRKIQTRPLFSGNITKHPAYKGVGRKVGTLSNSDAVLKNALLIGAHHGLTAPMLAHLFTVIDSFMKKRS